MNISDEYQSGERFEKLVHVDLFIKSSPTVILSQHNI